MRYLTLNPKNVTRFGFHVFSFLPQQGKLFIATSIPNRLI